MITQPDSPSASIIAVAMSALMIIFPYVAFRQIRLDAAIQAQSPCKRYQRASDGERFAASLVSSDA